MSFFQNPFFDEYRGSWSLGDRQYSPTFVCPINTGRGIDIVQSHGVAPYKLTGNDADGHAVNVLNIRFALDSDLFKNWADIAVTLPSSANATAWDVVAALNQNATFAAYFGASVNSSNAVLIRQKLPATRFRFYILNSQAETVLLFNKFAGVAELPTYFTRHSVDNRWGFEDANNKIVLLNPSTSLVDAAVVNNAVDPKGNNKGLDASSPKDDYKMLEGRSGIFNFQKITVDTSDRISEMIEYPAGSVVGALARKTTYTYTGTNKTPSTMKQVPYTLTSGDLI